MNIRDIAKRAGVSVATVSRTVNLAPTVQPVLTKRVWKAIDALGYYPSRQARALGSGRSRIFGLFVSEITNPFFAEIVDTFESLAIENNYEILLSSMGRDPKRLNGAARRMIEGRVDGVAILAFGMEQELLEHFRARNLPIVIVDAGCSEPRVSEVHVDYLDGIRQAVQHLAALRHRRINFLSGPLALRSAMARKEAFSRAMREVGLPVRADSFAEGDHTVTGGKIAFQTILKLRHPPTALLCSNDMTAIGVMREAQDRGIQIPKQLSLIGFDDIRTAAFMNPPLTTIQMSQSELATVAFHALLDEANRTAATCDVKQYDLRTRLILRKSTAFPRSEPSLKVSA